MHNLDIQCWLRYWKAADMVAFSEINTQEDLEQARRFCSVMRTGLFADMSTSLIWYSLRELINHAWLIPKDDYGWNEK